MVTETIIPKGYKNTDVGVIPDDWEVKELRTVVHFKNGKAHESYIADRGDYIVINSKFISSEGDVFKYSNRNLSPVDAGDIALVMSDIPNGKALAKCYLVKQDNKFALNQRICSLKANEVNNVFLFYALNRNKYFLQFDNGVSQTNLRRDDILKCPLPIPSTDIEQTAIANSLNDVDALINKLEELIAKKRNIKQGAMQELLTGKKRLPGFSGKWEVKKIGEVAEITKGQGLSKGKISYSGKYHCILYGELFTTYKEEITNVQSKTDFSEGRLSKYGDVLIPGSTTTTGIDLAKASALMMNGVLLGGDINIIRNSYDSYNPTFLAYYLTHVCKNKIAQRAKGITIYHLHGKDLMDLEIIMPKKEEQSAIAQVLSDVDAEIEQLEQKLDKYKMIKQGMMQELLTGRMRLI